MVGRQSLISASGAIDVAQEHLLDQLERRILERVHVPGADVAAVVDQHVDAAEAGERGVDRGRPVGALRQVELRDVRVDAERAHLGRRLLEAARAAGRSTTS